MKEVLHGFLSEGILKYFEPEDWVALRSVLDDVLAKEIYDYTKQCDSDKEVVSTVEAFLGDSIRRLTIHFELKSRGILDMVKTLTPEVIISVPEQHIEMLEKLEWLEANSKDCMPTIPVRTRKQFEVFVQRVTGAQDRMVAAGNIVDYPSLRSALTTNSYVFYDSNSKPRATGAAIINNRKMDWQICLKGIRYLMYVNENNVSANLRGFF